jgi:hypothetical protein
MNIEIVGWGVIKHLSGRMVHYLMKLRIWSKTVLSVMLPDDSWIVSTTSTFEWSKTKRQGQGSNQEHLCKGKIMEGR